MGKKSKVTKDKDAIQREYTEIYNRIKNITEDISEKIATPRRIDGVGCANFEYWNRLPIVSLRQAICLTLDGEPTNIFFREASKKRIRDLERMVASHRIAGSLQFFNNDQIYATDWLNWLSSVAIVPPKEWQPIDNNGKTFVADSSGESAELVADMTIIDAIADDIYNRMKSDTSENMRRVGLQKIYDFLITKTEIELPAKYQLPVMSYWLIDEKEVQRGLYEIGKKIGLKFVEIQYKNGDTDDCGSIPFLKVWEAFNEIKSR